MCRPLTPETVLVHPVGFEPTALGLKVLYSTTELRVYGSGGRIRTSSPAVNSRLRCHCATPEFWTREKESNLQFSAYEAGELPLLYPALSLIIITFLFYFVKFFSFKFQKIFWRRVRDSNPGYLLRYTRLAGVRFKPDSANSPWRMEWDSNPRNLSVRQFSRLLL